MSLGTPRETWHGSDATWRGGHDEMRSDDLLKGRNGGTGYAARDMARQVKWADPALRREREGSRVRERREREREKERTRATGRRACEKGEREKEREERTLARGSERSERERGDTRARKEREK